VPETQAAPGPPQFSAAHSFALVAVPLHEKGLDEREIQVPPPAPSLHHSQLAPTQPLHDDSSPHTVGDAVSGCPPSTSRTIAESHELNSQASHVPDAGPRELPATHIPVEPQKPQPEPALVQSPHAGVLAQSAALGETHATPSARQTPRTLEVTRADHRNRRGARPAREEPKGVELIGGRTRRGREDGRDATAHVIRRAAA